MAQVADTRTQLNLLIWLLVRRARSKLLLWDQPIGRDAEKADFAT
ncbi:MAG: hypothetical protein AAFR70_14820 [Pseudomonadota bacterium]